MVYKTWERALLKMIVLISEKSQIKGLQRNITLKIRIDTWHLVAFSTFSLFLAIIRIFAQFCQI